MRGSLLNLVQGGARCTRLHELGVEPVRTLGVAPLNVGYEGVPRSLACGTDLQETILHPDTPV